MTHYHYFPETNFFIDNPNFNEYLFDTKPYTVVICRAVIREIVQGFFCKIGSSASFEVNERAILNLQKSNTFCRSAIHH